MLELIRYDLYDAIYKPLYVVCMSFAMISVAEPEGAYPQALGHKAPEDAHLPHLRQVLHTGQ